MESSASVAKDPRLQLLAAQSLMECKQYEECLKYLDDNVPEGCLMEKQDPKRAAGFAFLRGQVHELLDNQDQALRW